MHRKYFISVVVTAILALAGCALLGTWVLGRLDQPDNLATRLSSLLPGLGGESKPAGDKKNDTSISEKLTASMDVAVLDSKGVSVFAGRANPEETVTVMAEGKPIGTAKADEYGEWTLEVDKGLKSNDDRITLRTTPPGGKVPAVDSKPVREVHADGKKVAEASSRANAQDKPASTSQSNQTAKVTKKSDEPGRKQEKTVAAVESRLMKKIEEMVSAAKKEANKASDTAPVKVARSSETASQPDNTLENKPGNTKAGETAKSESNPTPKTSTAVNEGTGSSTSTLNSSPGKQKDQTPRLAASTAQQDNHADAKNAKAPASSDKKLVINKVPVLIKFVYREATFTPEGKKAAALLSEYVNLKKFKSITLSGHADERGTNEHNMDLSQLRLDAVASYLKERGYNGELVLVPKGETEPFQGIDRSAYPIEDVYQLDRRVELEHRQ